MKWKEHSIIFKKTGAQGDDIEGAVLSHGRVIY